MGRSDRERRQRRPGKGRAGSGRGGATAATEPTDEELMLAVQGGDREAFATLYERHKGPVYGICRSLIPDRARAEDAFTDAFLNVLKKAHTFKPGRPVAPWLYRIARNRCLNLRREEGRRKTLSLDRPAGAAAESGESLGAVVPGADSSPDHKAARRETSARVRAAVDELPDAMREVILLRMFQGLSCKEIAAVVGCPVGTVWSRLHNAMDKLRVDLGELEDPGG